MAACLPTTTRPPIGKCEKAEWEFVLSLLPVSSRGRKRLDDRRVLNGIVWKFRIGTAWRDVPERYGP
ncbi:transposase [Streptomyces sp. CoH27]|uniref:transposase n=1 Tax=Streptomyces sp. CoH27 TaxID=2875763 RepID=UPI0035A8A9FD